MLTGPRGEKRPADVIGAAIMVAKIATGEIKEHALNPTERVRNGKAGAQARPKKLSKSERSEIAGIATLARWSK
jgi:hypothetical protein